MESAMPSKLLTALVAGLLLCTQAIAAPDYDALADAIKKVEGVPSYGIKSVHYEDFTEARRICIRTAQHAWRRYRALKGLETSRNGFLRYLADRYCPAKTDFEGNRRWKVNIIKLYRGDI